MKPGLWFIVHLCMLVYDAILRPKRFVTFLEGGWRNIGLAALATLLWVGAALAFVGLILPQLVPLGPTAPLFGVLIAPMCAIFCSAVGLGSSSVPGQFAVTVFFWILRSQIVVNLPMALLFVFFLSTLPLEVEHTGLVCWGIFMCFGAWIGDCLLIQLIYHATQDEAAIIRWLVGIVAIIIAGLYQTRWSIADSISISSFLSSYGSFFYWESYGGVLSMVRDETDLFFRLWAIRESFFAMLTPLLPGLSIGLLRPINWLWQSLWSIVLLIAQTFGASSSQVRILHPVHLDELCLLPLPGLHTLLVRACAEDIESGAEWLTDVANHAGKRHAAVAALQTIAGKGQLAHPLLFRLSISEAGSQLLRELSQESRQIHPLIQAYAALSQVAEPGAWSTVLHYHWSAIEEYIQIPESFKVIAFLGTGKAVLSAVRWSEAVEAMHTLPVPPSRFDENNALWAPLNTLQQLLTASEPVPDVEHITTIHNLYTKTDQFSGWSSAFLEDIREHLLFLLRVEQHHGGQLS